MSTSTCPCDDGSDFFQEDDGNDDGSISTSGDSNSEVTSKGSSDSSSVDTLSSTLIDTSLEDDSEEAQQVRLWAEAVPIGLGLCPWAMTAQRQRRIRYRTCVDVEITDAANTVRCEAEHLVHDNPLPLHTTLVVCPNINDWNTSHDSASPNYASDENIDGAFQKFQNFVRSLNSELQQEKIPVTLVAFHPQFLQWRDLPRGMDVGSTVQAHKMCGGIFQKSTKAFEAIILETQNPVFGLRKIKVRFHETTDDGTSSSRKEQYIPVDWLVLPSETPLGEPLPDNLMHRSPYPTIHIIQDSDLGSLRARDVSRVKRKNAQRMLKLGWEGVLVKTASQSTVKSW